MRAIACAHTITSATSLTHVKKKAHTTFALSYITLIVCLGHWNEENQNIKHQME